MFIIVVFSGISVIMYCNICEIVIFDYFVVICWCCLMICDVSCILIVLLMVSVSVDKILVSNSVENIVIRKIL